MKKIMYLLFIAFNILIACENDDKDASSTPKETCEDGIKNQDEDQIDCGGICTACISEILFIEEGNYRGLWNSNATNGSVYTDLKITATIKKITETTYTGSLFISDNYTSCCNSSGTNGDGPISIKIEDGKITFKWIDEIPTCKGEFDAIGAYSEKNKFFLNLTGKDCEGDHKGSIEFFK